MIRNADFLLSLRKDEPFEPRDPKEACSDYSRSRKGKTEASCLAAKCESGRPFFHSGHRPLSFSVSRESTSLSPHHYIHHIYIYKRQLLKSLCQAIRQDACSWDEMDLSNVFVQDMFIQKRTGRDSRYDGEDESGDWHEHEDVQPWGHSEDLRSIYAPYIMHNNG